MPTDLAFDRLVPAPPTSACKPCGTPRPAEHPVSRHASTDAPLRIALHRTGDGAFATDEHGAIVEWNAAAEALLGYSAREASGRSCCQLLDGHDAFGNRMCVAGCQVARLLHAGEPVRTFEMRARTKSERGVRLSISVLAAASGPRARAIHLVRDVSAGPEAASHRNEWPEDGPRPVPKAADELTRRERHVLRLLTEGASTASVAQQLHVSPSTVRNHVQNVFAKLGVHTRLEAVAYATRHKLF